MRITSLLSAAVMATSIDALHVRLVRYSKPGCPNGSTIGKSTDMHDDTCKTFHHHDAPIESFNVTATKDRDDLDKKLCRLTVFDQADCKGHGFAMDDLKSGGCGTAPLGMGRSAQLKCDKPEHPKSHTSHRPVTHTVHVPDVHTIVVTPSADASAPLSTKTIWLAPQATGKCNCFDSGED